MIDVDAGLVSTPFGQTVRALAARHDLDCVVELKPLDHRCLAETRPLSRRIVISSLLLVTTPEHQEFTAAHEVGHLICTRERGRLRMLPVAAMAWGLLAGLLGFLMPAVLVLLIRPLLPTAAPMTIVGIGAGALALGVTLAVLCGRYALILRAAHMLPIEIEADAFAKREGYPVTPAIADTLEMHEGWGRGALSQRYRTHLSPVERINDGSR